LKPCVAIPTSPSTSSFPRILDVSLFTVIASNDSLPRRKKGIINVVHYKIRSEYLFAILKVPLLWYHESKFSN
jgi:hypothetical protein